ncbi:unnamed protein product, partial [Prorocentrum cordatum]
VGGAADGDAAPAASPDGPAQCEPTCDGSAEQGPALPDAGAIGGSAAARAAFATRCRRRCAASASGQRRGGCCPQPNADQRAAPVCAGFALADDFAL